jgi:thiamine-monophosphate kinase
MSRSGEFDLIRRLLAPLTRGAPGAFNLTDDAAVLAVSHGCEMVVTKDAVVADVHFFPDDPPDLIARKALRVNLSDLAAKGAKPVGFFMALMLPESIDDAWLETFTHGLGQDIDAYQCPLMGGDTTATPGPLAVSITAIGEVKTGHMTQRAGALPGDVLCVSGTIGDAALGLAVARGEYPQLSAAHRAFLLDRYRLPQPRLTLGQAEASRDSACIDISDGLCADVDHICARSGVAAVIEADKVPLSDAARAALTLRSAALSSILTGGDDYELAFAVPPANLAAARAHGAKVGVPVTAIGRLEAGRGVSVLDGAGRPVKLASLGYEHR